MKHLKRFNESVNNEVIQNIEDILSDLTDDGFNVDIIPYGNSICVNITKKGYFYIYFDIFHTDIKDCIIRLIDYMDSESYQYYIKDETDNIDDLESLLKRSYGIFKIEFALRR